MQMAPRAVAAAGDMEIFARMTKTLKTVSFFGRARREGLRSPAVPFLRAGRTTRKSRKPVKCLGILTVPYAYSSHNNKKK